MGNNHVKNLRGNSHNHSNSNSNGFAQNNHNSNPNSESGQSNHSEDITSNTDAIPIHENINEIYDPSAADHRVRSHSQYTKSNQPQNTFSPTINHSITLPPANVQKDLVIMNNFLRKTNEYYTNALFLIKETKIYEAIKTLEKAELGLVKLEEIVAQKPKCEEMGNMKNKIQNCLESIREKKEHCNQQLEKVEKVRNYFSNKPSQIASFKIGIANKNPNSSSNMKSSMLMRSTTNGLHHNKNKNISIIKNVNQNQMSNYNTNYNSTNKGIYASGIKTRPSVSLGKEYKPEPKSIKNNDDIHEKIYSEIMVKNPNVSFKDIIGLEEVKKILKEIVVLPNLRPDLFTGLRSPPRGLLLFGPPGTGKTLIAKAVASEINNTFFNISASSLTSKWVGESEKLVRALFELASKHQPSIIFIDEIDSILSKRGDNDNEAAKRLKTEFLVQFDGLASNPNDRILLIAATNRPQDLDYAVLRRLPKRVYIGPLNEKGRFNFLKTLLNKVDTNLKEAELINIAKLTPTYSNSDLRELCRDAAFQPVRELGQADMIKIKKLRPLVYKDFLIGMKNVRGTLSNDVIEELEKWNNEYGALN